jgi:TolA-binding protein
MHKIFIFIITGLFYFLPVISQKSSFDNSPDELYRRAEELFNKEKYVAAQKYFLEVINLPGNSKSQIKCYAEYYAALCAIKLFNDDADAMGIRFIANNPESPLVNDTYFQLANFQYDKKRYRQSVGYYGKVNKELLSGDAKAEYYFKTGYSWFLLDSLNKARIAFYEIKDIDTKYTSAAIYYYSHIAYVQKNYETAIAGFLKLKDEEEFAPIVPYYITQCYYYQEKYDDLLAYAPPLMDSVIDTRVAEMAKMIGDAYYRKNKLKEAIPYLEKFIAKSKEVKPNEYYELGFCYYQQNNYNNAAAMFEKSIGADSTVMQNASYHLGDCYIKLNEKKKALSAFAIASKINNNPKIKEDALFNYAVLSYELASVPFNDAIKALNNYISQYPESNRSDEAYQYLVMAYLNTHNYQNALSYIEKIKAKDKNIKKAYQRITFFRGLELFNNLQFDAALKMFEKSLNFADFDPVLTARAYYWSAESYYRLNKYSEAIDSYNLFLASPVAMKCEEYNLATYNLGYCFFNKKDYDMSAFWFSKYIESNIKSKTKFLADAYNRKADCSFMKTQYQDAVECYGKSIEIGLADKDYAMYQKAFSLGLLNKYDQKIALLNQLINEMPNSRYVDDALYETGLSYLILQNNEQASNYFSRVIKDYPSSSYVPKSFLKLGLIQYNSGKPQAALDTYKRVVAGYPNTDESRSALTGIKNIYVEINDVDSYIKYTDKLGSYGNVSTNEQDSLTYIAAENIYTSGDYKKAKVSFKKYIEKFPEGSFVINANYYLGDCYYKNKEYDSALIAFNFVIGKPVNNYTEQSLLLASRINFQFKNYQAALDDYRALESKTEQSQNISEARISQMRINFLLNNYDSAIQSANKVLNTENIAAEIERQARLIKGRSLMALNQNGPALEELKKVASDVKNVEGANAKYLIAQYYFDQKQYDKCEKEIFNFIDLNTPHQYWLAKAFILLSDIYVKRNDKYQALSTLQSIIDNYVVQNDGIIYEALQKEKLLSDMNEKTDSTKKKDDIEIKAP